MNRLGRVAVSSVSWILAILMSVIYGLLIAFYLALRFQDLPPLSSSGWPSIPLFGPSLTVIAIGAWILLTLLFRRKKWDVKGLRRMACLMVLAIPLVYLAIDEPPSKPIYTRADLPPPAKDAEESYKTLMTFRRDGGLELKVDIPYGSTNSYPWLFPTNIMDYADAVEKAWKDVGKGWEVIEKLDSFSAIADLLPETPLDDKTPVPGFLHLRNMVRVCWRYAVLKTEQGKPDEGVHALCRLHSVTLKALPYSSTLVSKMIWVAIAKGNMQTAYHIADSKQCTPEALRTLSATFAPLAWEDVSVRRSMIAEHLFSRTTFHKIHSKDPGLISAFTCSTNATLDNPLVGLPFLKVASFTIGPFFVNLNMTDRELEAAWDSVLSGVSKQPPTTLDTVAETIEAKLRSPSFKNMGGQAMVAIAIPAFLKSAENAWKMKVLSDLLAIELRRRLGEKLVLTDAYTGKPYFVDEATGIAGSVGPDGKPGTADDIKLGDWPG